MRGRTVAVAAGVTLAVLAGCSSDSKESMSGSSSTRAAKAEELQILVSNDDGYAAGSQKVPGKLTTSSRTTKSGYPALAASQGLATTPDYQRGVELVVEWVTARRAALVADTASKDIVNLNIPTCPSGSVRGLKQEPLSTSGPQSVAPAVYCKSTKTRFTDDAAAFAAGFATATELGVDGQTATTSTTWPASR